MKIAQEFREFISRGNVIDLAVGVIIGAAFGKIVNSLVSDIIMPPIGALLKGVNFSNLYLAIDGKTYETLAKAKEAGAPVVTYGLFINQIIEFFIIAACVFVLVKIVNQIKRAPAPAPARRPPPATAHLDADGVANATQVLDVRVVQLPRALAAPQEVRRAVVPAVCGGVQPAARRGAGWYGEAKHGAVQ